MTARVVGVIESVHKPDWNQPSCARREGNANRSRTRRRELYETLEQHADSQQRLQRSQFYAAFEDLLDDRTAGSCCNLRIPAWSVEYRKVS